MKKKLLILIPILLIIILFLLALVWVNNPIKNLDFTEKYKDYLDYSLGDWKIETVEHNKKIYKFKLYAYDYWTISFKDDEGENQLIRISNEDMIYYKDREKASDYLFANQILYEYVNKVERKLIKENDMQFMSSVNLIERYKYEKLLSKDSLNIIDTKNGLYFRDIDLDKLKENSYYVEISILYDNDQEKDFDYKEYTIEKTKLIIDKFSFKNVVVSAAQIKHDDYTMKPIYCLKDGKEDSCPYANDLDTLNSYFVDTRDFIEIK